MEKIPSIETSETENEKSFEAQFAVREHFEVAGGLAEVVDITPEKIKDEVPVFLAPAWACDINTYEGAIKTLSKRERRVISMTHPRYGGDLKSRNFDEEIKKYPIEELRKAQSIIDVLRQKGITKVDAIAHSEAGINLTIAATLHPEMFRNIVYYAPAGLIGNDNLIRLATGFSKQGESDKSLEDRPDDMEAAMKAKVAAEKYTKKYLSNPFRSAKEVIAMSRTQIQDMVRNLHDQGIGIVVASGIEDPVFPTEKMEQVAKLDMIDGFLTTRGGHGEIGGPEEVMIAVDRMLTGLQEQRERAKTAPKQDLLREFE